MLIIFAVLTCVMTNPLVLHLAHAVEDKQDSLLNTWIISWVGHALINDPLNLFNANIFYPYPNTLAFSETLIPQGLFALSFNLAFDNTILGYNLVLLASFFLAAYTMYLFVFDLGRNRTAGIVAGIIFAYNPYNLGNLAQVQLLSFGWMPLALFWLRRLLHKSTADSQQSIVRYFQLSIVDFRLVFLFAIFFSLQALSSFYYAFLAGFAVALYILWFFLTQRVFRFLFYVSRFTRLLISAILIAIIVVPFFIPYLQVQQQMGFERKVTESEPFSASLKLYTEVSPQNVVYGNLFAPRPPLMLGGYPLDNLFPGFVAVMLAIIGIVASKNRERWFYFFLLAFAFLLSLGPRLFLAPNIGTDITLPYLWLYDAFPLMKALRAPVRFDALVMFALAVLAGYSFSPIAHHARFARFTFYVLLIPLVALEYLAFPTAQITFIPTGDAIPQYAQWLRQQPTDVVLELPMIASDPSKPLDLTTQYLSTYHWHASPDGYSGFNPQRRGEIAYEMQAFPNERSLALMQSLDVEYLIVHSDRWVDWNLRQETLGRFMDLQLVNQIANDYIYRVNEIPQRRAFTAQLYLPNPAAPNQNYFAYLILRNRTSRVITAKPTETLRFIARWSDGSRLQFAAPMPLVTSSVAVVPVRLTPPPQAGKYQLELQVFGDGFGPLDIIEDVNVANGESAHQVVLPARAALSTLSQTQYVPGEALSLDVTWLPFNKIDAYYSASVRIVDARGNKIVSQDRQPIVPTLLWRPGNSVPDNFGLTLPPTIAPGEYSIQLLMYQADQGIDALLLDEYYAPHEITTLGKFTVK